MMRRTIFFRAIQLVLAGAAVLSLRRLGLLDPATLWPAARRLADFASSLVPPNADILPTLLDAMLETLEIAFVGTGLGFVIALPLAVLGTSTVFGPRVTVPVRLVVGAIRTVPSLLWAVVFVVGFGLGPAAGALGVAMYSVGYLCKLLYEAFEGVDAEVIEAVRGSGANRVQIINFAVLPESANAMLSQLLFMFEYNIRASAIMGFVGAGGIGYYMLGYLQLLQYRNLTTALLLTFAVVMAVDFLSAALRSLVVPGQPKNRVPLLAGLVPA
jgi:phosphonate transport system permease protein